MSASKSIPLPSCYAMKFIHPSSVSAQTAAPAAADTETLLAPATSCSTPSGTPRSSQASRKTQDLQRVRGLPRGLHLVGQTRNTTPKEASQKDACGGDAALLRGPPRLRRKPILVASMHHSSGHHPKIRTTVKGKNADRQVNGELRLSV